MKILNLYPIQYVARHTGLSPHVIRAWEKRYGAVVPRRTAGNRRIYSEKDLKRLQMLAAAVAAGHLISQVAALTTAELATLLKPLPAPAPSTATPNAAGSTTAGHLQACLTAVRRLDPDALEKALGKAAVALTRPAFSDDLIAPLFQEIGESWERGALKIINEHMATAVVRSMLWDLLRSTAVAAWAPKIVIATPAGQWHDIGALLAALAAAESGWQPVYFGPNLPAEEICAAVSETAARAAALSIAHQIDAPRLHREISRLHKNTAERVSLFAGGTAAAAVAGAVCPERFGVMADTASIRRALTAAAARD